MHGQNHIKFAEINFMKKFSAVVLQQQAVHLAALCSKRLIDAANMRLRSF